MTAIVRPDEVIPTTRVQQHEELGVFGLAKAMHKSGMFPDVQTAEQAVVKILAGQEIGLGPFAAMSGIHIIKGKAVLGANILATCINRSGAFRYRVLEHTDKLCRLRVDVRNGAGWEALGESSFSAEDAKTAGVASNDNWRKWPKNMLFARAISNAVRFYCPEVLGGGPMYTADEMGMESDGDWYVDTSTGEVFDHPPITEKPQNRVSGSCTNGRAASTQAAVNRASPEVRGSVAAQDMRSPAEVARASYFAALHAKFPEVEGYDELRYALEAILSKRTEPIKAGAKAKWDAARWDSLRIAAQAVTNPGEAIQAARDLLDIATTQAETLPGLEGDPFAEAEDLKYEGLAQS